MESVLTVSANESTWEIVPANIAAGTILTILFIYLLFRHFMFVLMFMDLILSWLRRFNWFPGSGKRWKAFIHWIIALTLFLAFLFVGGFAGWLDFLPQ